jgi:hypothetical protein
MYSTFSPNSNFSGVWPKGIPTFWSLTHPRKTSTIDLTVTDSPRRLLKCHLYHDHYGSDHRATYSVWALYPDHRAEPKPKRVYERADWAKIRSLIQDTLQPWPPLGSVTELEQAVEKMILSTTAAIERYIPIAKRCPYSKRSFAPELKIQQMEVNRARRKWQENCATKGPQHPDTIEIFEEMWRKRRE